ncbi:beta-ketoacyl-ACP synthase II [Gammaproteobacteria bacterium]|jgi:3-oxoacyl-[acyl-carrier-protein] synthase-1|nr:beta-ketoacyl-ACP synthase II [Gammaproteobacteria bacterium]MDA9561938.1 beta-ketoacyl-ACP synthase II [Gammaproteobacteria bacterium]MDA9804987.1 beta-ketoacyl-ACP synthase II [Gammaproteobacteria bacterium]MDB2604900.1 beta-ketoacyl-ACP synthase II [Gammaproteobacteria bacterium]MDC0962253.1 beta-ketoacyl-ACP synthase II [Gammaproteobacteria bacterium]|tara:strand:+ start:283 stop:1491 length:1209 start_codon:yes stop_codon:yes gene_type:complete
MRNVVITGVGIKSCIGNTYNEVLNSLKDGKSGITANETYKEMGFRSQVSGSVDINFAELIDRKLYRFMGEASAYAYLAAKDAIEMSGITESHLDSIKTGIVAGSGGSSTRVMLSTSDITRDKGPKRIGPYAVTKTMGSSISAILATAFKLKGINYSISSACATSAHCIGHSADLIKSGQQDIVIAGGGEDLHWSSSNLFDAMGALSSNFNDDPAAASRAYDKDRDGFVISGGSGMLILEEEEHAKKRGANILAKISGYYATSDGYDMVAPSGEGAYRCMEGALQNYGSSVDYINTHGTSTPVGDVAELTAIKELFKQEIPVISSTKSMTGHSLGATGAQEAIYSIMMLRDSFIAPSINISNLCDEAEGIHVNTETLKKDIKAVLSNSFGFGGTNASLVITKY